MKDKAKRKDNGEWVEEYVVVYPSGKAEIHKISKELPDILLICEIDPDTLCQYTGLTDKNGRKIWENDICDRYEEYPEIVVYNEGDWQLDYSYAFKNKLHTNACNLGFYVCARNCVKVIGNIFDNPELLGG